MCNRSRRWGAGAIGNHIEDGHAIAPMISDYESAAVRRDMHLNGLFASPCDEYFAPEVKVNDADAVRAVVGNVSTVSARFNSDEGWPMPDRDRRNNTIRVGVDDRNRARLRIRNVNLISSRIDGHLGWVGAHLERAVLTKVDKIKYGDRIRSRIADVGVLPIARWNVRKTVPMTAEEG